jgi:hypothetical protein
LRYRSEPLDPGSGEGGRTSHPRRPQGHEAVEVAGSGGPGGRAPPPPPAGPPPRGGRGGVRSRSPTPCVATSDAAPEPGRPGPRPRWRAVSRFLQPRTARPCALPTSLAWSSGICGTTASRSPRASWCHGVTQRGLERQSTTRSSPSRPRLAAPRSRRRTTSPGRRSSRPGCAGPSAPAGARGVSFSSVSPSRRNGNRKKRGVRRSLEEGGARGGPRRRPVGRDGGGRVAEMPIGMVASSWPALSQRSQAEVRWTLPLTRPALGPCRPNASSKPRVIRALVHVMAAPPMAGSTVTRAEPLTPARFFAAEGLTPARRHATR